MPLVQAKTLPSVKLASVSTLDLSAIEYKSDVFALVLFNTVYVDVIALFNAVYVEFIAEYIALLYTTFVPLYVIALLTFTVPY